MAHASLEDPRASADEPAGNYSFSHSWRTPSAGGENLPRAGDQVRRAPRDFGERTHALEMCAGLAQVNAERGAHPRIHVGPHSGLVNAGVIGAGKITYAVWRHTVNLASRMKSNGLHDQIHVSGDRAAPLAPDFLFESRGENPIRDMGDVETFLLKAWRQR